MLTPPSTAVVRIAPQIPASEIMSASASVVLSATPPSTVEVFRPKHDEGHVVWRVVHCLTLFSLIFVTMIDLLSFVKMQLFAKEVLAQCLLCCLAWGVIIVECRAGLNDNIRTE